MARWSRHCARGAAVRARRQMDWREGGVRIRSQYLLEEAEDGRRDVAEVEEEAEQRHGRR